MNADVAQMNAENFKHSVLQEIYGPRFQAAEILFALSAFIRVTSAFICVPETFA
jgi:hypothetical protein